MSDITPGVVCLPIYLFDRKFVFWIIRMLGVVVLEHQLLGDFCVKIARILVGIVRALQCWLFCSSVAFCRPGFHSPKSQGNAKISVRVHVTTFAAPFIRRSNSQRPRSTSIFGHRLWWRRECLILSNCYALDLTRVRLNCIEPVRTAYSGSSRLQRHYSIGSV